MIRIRFLPAAEQELLKQIAYYSQARDGTGIRFEAAVRDAVAMAVAYPRGGAPAPKGTRRFLVKPFPFSVVYRATEQEILVVAIAHHRRRPGYWSGRIGGRRNH